MSRIDTLSDLSALQQMKYVEFLVFIARISHEVYKGTKQESQLLHLKIDKCLTPLLGYVQLEKQFSFKAEEEEGGDLEGSDEDGDEVEEKDKDGSGSNGSNNGDWYVNYIYIAF